MNQSFNFLVSGKYGIIKKNILKANFPNIYIELDKISSKYYESPDEVKIIRFMESEFNYSINTDPIVSEEDLYIPRITIHKADPSKTFTWSYPKALELKCAQAKASFLALEYLESTLSNKCMS